MAGDKLEVKVSVLDVDEVQGQIEDLVGALRLAHKALTRGIEDIPSDMADPICARLRVAAKREITRVLGEIGMHPDQDEDREEMQDV